LSIFEVFEVAAHDAQRRRALGSMGV